MLKIIIGIVCAVLTSFAFYLMGYTIGQSVAREADIIPCPPYETLFDENGDFTDEGFRTWLNCDD